MTHVPVGTDTDVFEAERPRLVGLAYRMLDTIDDAEDVVQEVWLRWQRTDAEQIERPVAWLTTVATRLALDRLRQLHRRRETYVGPWLPEPLVTDLAPDDAVVLAETLRLGFLTVLDELKPVERAVFLMADVFDVPYAEIAPTVGKSEPACRQIASRARQRVRNHPGSTARTSDREIVDALLVAIATGDVARVLDVVAPDVVCVSDGGPDKRAARRPVVGAPRVARLLINLAKRFADEIELTPVGVNGDPGVVMTLNGTIDMVTAFEVHEGVVVAIRIFRNPDKLTHVGGAPALR